MLKAGQKHSKKATLKVEYLKNGDSPITMVTLTLTLIVCALLDFKKNLKILFLDSIGIFAF